jgi:flagellar hook-length control protein FliK
LKGSGSPDIANAALAVLAKKSAKDSKSASDAVNVVAVPVDTAIANSAAAASSTTAAIPDIHGGDKTVKSDSSAKDVAQASAPPPDPSADQTIPVAPPPIAAVISAPVISAPPTSAGNASNSASGTGQDGGQSAALGDAAKAGAPSGQADPTAPETTKAGSPIAAGIPQADGAPKAGAKSASTPASPQPLAPQPFQKESNLPTGQPNAADATQSRGADASSAAAAAATDRASQRARASQQSDGTAAAPDNANANTAVDPNSDPKQGPAGSAAQIQDVTRQALDATVRRGEAPTAETASGGSSHAESVQAGNVPPSPDGSANLVAPTILSTSASPTAAPATTAPAAAIPVNGLAVAIASHAHAGSNRFDIRLDPPELGRIDVRLDVDRDGKVTSHLVVDRPETLAMLRRDAPQLEHSLQQAGLKTADDALQFSLRDQGGFGGQNPNPNFSSPADTTRVVIPDRSLPPVETTMAAYSRVTGASTGIDIRV